jgi:sucrose phosphorylase
MVYNFTLAPLIVWTVMAERAEEITGWLGRLPPAPPGCTFFNFLASHDGIGVRPIEDLVGADDLRLLLHGAEQVGGAWSEYSAPGGPRPYEINVSLADLLAGLDGASWPRFVAAHAVMLAVQGVPAFYVHSLFASPGDLEAMQRTGHRRDINRSLLTLDQIEQRLASGWRAEAFDALAALIRLRRRHAAFDPAADQIVHVLDERVVAIERRGPDQRILALQNVSSHSVDVTLPEWAGARDLVTDTDRPASPAMSLAPWQTVWLT